MSSVAGPPKSSTSQGMGRTEILLRPLLGPAPGRSRGQARGTLRWQQPTGKGRQGRQAKHRRQRQAMKGQQQQQQVLRLGSSGMRPQVTTLMQLQVGVVQGVARALTGMDGHPACMARPHHSLCCTTNMQACGKAGWPTPFPDACIPWLEPHSWYTLRLLSPTGMYYDSNTGYYFIQSTQQWCTYDEATGQYVPVSSAAAAAKQGAGPTTAGQGALAATEYALAASKARPAHQTVAAAATVASGPRAASTATVAAAPSGAKAGGGAAAAGEKKRGAVIGAAPQLNPHNLLAHVQLLDVSAGGSCLRLVGFRGTGMCVDACGCKVRVQSTWWLPHSHTALLCAGH